MNILFMTSTFPRFEGDSQAPFALEQAEAWKRACPEDNVFILAPHDPQAKEQENRGGISIRRFVYMWPTSAQMLVYSAILPNIRKNPLLILEVPFFLMAEFVVALKLIRKHKIDRVYAHWVFPQGFTAYLLNKACKVPYVLQNHSSDLRIFHKFSFLGRFLARKIIANAKALFCVNSLLKEEALEFFKDELPDSIREKIFALPMGIGECVSQQGGPSDIIYDFSVISRLSKKKRIDLFINALAELKKRGVHFRAAVAGDGEEKDALQKLSSDGDIEFLGFLSGDRKASFFKQTKSIIFASQPSQGDIEGLPVALLEAIFAQKVVIATPYTNIQLLPEWPQLADTIFLLDDPGDTQKFADLLETVLRLEENEVRSRTSKARSAIARYAWNNLIQEYLSHIKK